MKRLSIAGFFLFLLSLAAIAVHLGCGSRMAAMQSVQPQNSFCDQSELVPSKDALAAAACPSLKSQALREAGVPSTVAAEPGSEELLVIEKDATEPAKDLRDETAPGTGSMLAKRGAGESQLVPIPLKHTDVKASVAGYIASVEVTQQFHNPYDDKIEAVYVFPLPQNAAINEFIMTVGTRHIRGIIRERQEAQRIYQEARAQGYVATLMTQERPNIFTQSVANIEPGKEIDVDIKYFNTLECVDGWYEFVFPMVVGPRFNPPGSSDGVGAVARGAGGSSGQQTELQYLRPDERSGHDIALSVHLDAGVAVEKIDCRNHHVSIAQSKPEAAEITLDPNDSIPNKDFVLRYKVAGNQLKSSAFACRDERGSYFTLMLFPPEELTDLPRQPLEMVFTIDVSGSQDGKPLEQEKAATRYALTHMDADDTFQVIRFGDSAQRLFEHPVPANETHVNHALQWVDSFDAHEGTMLVDGVHASLLFPADESRLRFVSFMTDGFIGNEEEALREIHRCLGPARIFSFGVGSSTNRYLLDHMAKMGNGAVAYLGLNDDANQVMADYFNRISHPALANATIDCHDANVSEVFPERVPDVFVGRPVVLTGRFTGATPSSIRVHGMVGGQERSYEVPLQIEGDPGIAKALPAIWARAKIADLGDRATWEPSADLAGQTRQLALEYNLISPYTAFVAVDSLPRTAGDHGTTVVVPVPVPDGVRYETTVTGTPHATSY